MKVLITGGPTNEYIDEVMKITNMSTGSLSIKLTELFIENVSKEELVEVAKNLCIKNNMDYILANDLAKLREGNGTRHAVSKERYTGIDLDTPEDIFQFIKKERR